MNYKNVFLLLLLPVISLSLTAGEKEAKKIAAMQHMKQAHSKYVYTIPLDTVLKKPAQSDPLGDGLRIGILLKMNELGISSDNINVKVAFAKNGLDITRMLEQIAVTQQSAGDETVINVDLVINKLEIAPKKHID